MTPGTARTLPAHFARTFGLKARTFGPRARTSRALFGAKVRAQTPRFRAWQDSEPPKNGHPGTDTRKTRALRALFTPNLLYMFEKKRRGGEGKRETHRKLPLKVREVREVREVRAHTTTWMA